MQLTLGQVLERLHMVHNDLAAAQSLLRKARDAEVEAVEAHRMATSDGARRHDVLPPLGAPPFCSGACSCGWQTALYARPEDARAEVLRHVQDARARSAPGG